MRGQHCCHTFSRMQAVLSVMALVGFAALATRTVRWLLVALLATAEATAAGGLAEVAARNGDLTGMAERQADRRAALRRRRFFLLLVVISIVGIFAAASAGVAREAYAAAALLWLQPSRAVGTGRRAPWRAPWRAP